MTSDEPSPRRMHADCVIAGGGPAGMMLGFLLAGAGIEVVVLEKHKDFLRDFRGDTIHPSTLELMHELGLLDDFLALPHQEQRHLVLLFGGETIPMVDFARLSTHCKFIAFMPQWDFLDFLADHAREYPNFRLLMETEALEVITEADVVTGLRAAGPDGALVIEAPLTVAADGRHSRLREGSGLPVEDFGAPMDVLWFRLDKREGGGAEPLAHFEPGRMLVMIDRRTYFQCGYVIPKGSVDELKAEGIEAFKAILAGMVPRHAGAISDLAGWDDIHLLSVQVNRLTQWFRPGLLFIGDAAHAMSPVAGVGINIAIQDAVGAANLLVGPLRRGAVSTEDLKAVQQRRAFAARATQQIQLLVQNQIIGPNLAARGDSPPPLLFRLFRRFPRLGWVPARLIGVGIRPEHISPQLRPSARAE